MRRMSPAAPLFWAPLSEIAPEPHTQKMFNGLAQEYQCVANSYSEVFEVAAHLAEYALTRTGEERKFLHGCCAHLLHTCGKLDMRARVVHKLNHVNQQVAQAARNVLER